MLESFEGIDQALSPSEKQTQIPSSDSILPDNWLGPSPFMLAVLRIPGFPALKPTDSHRKP